MQRQWIVTLQNLPAAGRSWDVDMQQKLMQDSSYGSVEVIPELCSDVHWQVTLEHTGELYRLHGTWRCEVKRQCSRCNASFNWQASGLSEREYQLGSVPVQEEDESACEFLALPGEVNLVDVLREDIWLGWKADVICSETCKGLCQGCGNNLNTEACQCKHDERDHPFAALRNLKLDG